MVKKAIKNAEAHGINLYHGVGNLANGDCAFESIIDSISTRPCFGETYDGTPAYWRKVWMSEIEKIAFEEWNGGLSLQEWRAGFEVLKQPGTYEFTLGDLVPPGIAHCTRKNILIFNTSVLAHSPVYVVAASTFGGSANTDIPVCLAYNQSHYESLVPCSEEDIEKTIVLTQQFLNGQYILRMEDIPLFKKEKEEFKNSYDIDFPALPSSKKNLPVGKPKVSAKRKKEVSHKNYEECLLTLDEIKKIPVKNRKQVETRRYKKLMEQKKKLKVTDELLEFEKKRKTENKKKLEINRTEDEKNVLREKAKLGMQNFRKKQTNDDKLISNQKEKERIYDLREKQTNEDKLISNQKEKERKHSLKEKQTNYDKLISNQKDKERMHNLREKQTNQDKLISNQKEKERKHSLKEKQTNVDKRISNQKDKERKQKSRKKKSELDRLLNFQKATRFGPIFVCSSCDQKMFENNVSKLDEALKIKLQEKNIETYNKVLANNLHVIEIHTSQTGEPVLSAYLCSTCKKHLNKGKVPPMSRANGLELIDLGNNSDLKLSELENNLISRRLLFQKIYQLPRSRMAGCKDRLINIPINDKDVLRTVENLPRTPYEAGLLEIKLKRKMEYNNFHKKEFVNPTKIFKALEFLKENKHPSYLFYDAIDEYEKRCKANDPIGYDLVFVYEDGIEKIVDIDEYLENLKNDPKVPAQISNSKIKADYQELDELEEIDCIKNDPIKKFQFDYDKSVCMVDKFPEAAVNDTHVKEAETLSFAPGEGKIPENILLTNNWDIDAFPMKYPDGKNGLHQNRERKLTDQYHFVQRLRNKDERFSSDPSYIFASAAYLEKKQLQRNVNVSFNRGKKSVTPSGENTYSLQDGFSVFDKISNTPSYWKTAKYEMHAKLENLGPFQFFFTLSCADSRWDENFSSILRSLDIRIKYEFDSKGKSETIVKTKDGEELELRKYLDTQVDKSLHEIIRTNVMNASRNYNHRVKAFITEIVMDKSNPMSVKHYSTKVEFQGRGAAHNHGTLWVDIKKMEFYFKQENGDWTELNDFLSEKQNTDTEVVSADILQNDLKKLFEKKYVGIPDGGNKFKEDSEDQERHELEDVLSKLFIKNDETKKNDIDTLLSRFPLYGISSAFKKFQTHEPLLPYEETAIINFANKYTTCTLNPASIAARTDDQTLKDKSSEVVDICKCVNKHSHTKTCRKYETICRFNFAKFPIWRTLISKPPQLPVAEKEKKMTEYKKILNNVKAILEEDELIQNILSEYPDKNKESREKYVENREIRIKKVLNLAGLKTEEDFNLYVEALEASKGGYSILLERDIDELYINSYNPEWARAWNGNTDLQICLDYFAVITYITEYYTKDDSGTMTLLLKALQESCCDTLKEKMITLMNTFIAARQMGETEAFYKIFPDFHLKDSNVTTVFVPVSKRENRSKFLLKLDEKMIYNDQAKFKIEGREGYYVEKYDIVSKYERSEEKPDDLSFSHYAKMYKTAWKDKTSKNEKETYENSDSEDEFENEDSKFDYVLKCFGEPHEDCKHRRTQKLPDYIKLEDVYPGEPPFMKKRQFPAVLRYHKFKIDTHPNDFLFSEALLYKPFKKEEDIQVDIDNLDDARSKEYNDQIQCVKEQVMEFLENVQEARYFAEENKRNEETEVILDPEGIQENDDCEYEGIINHPDYLEIDFEALEQEVKKKTMEKAKKFLFDDLEILMDKTRKLDFYQNKVVESAIKYSRGLVKHLKSKNSLPDPPKMMVHGGAGAGKSTVINVMKQWVHRILQASGDNPECPYILVTAPTGTAAANVRGQTLHTAFGFSFGNEHYSLSDKKRDEKRTLLKNLRFVIIDEISMVKSDLLYQLDMRLREVTQKPDKLFGGVAIYALGDILQLRPCQARYIFEEPVCQDYKISFFSGTHWKAFQVINLVENHRQEGDKEYADLLNRIRIGQQTAEDFSLLETRVRPLGHSDLDGAMYLTCTNVKVNEFNERGLNALDGELYNVQAVNIHPTISNFKAHVNSKGNIGTERNETPFRQNLLMKVGARIMLTYNIDVNDCLTNGARGEIVAFEKSKTGRVEKVIVRFDDECQGEEKRNSDKTTEQNYPGCTAIERVMFQYSLGKKKSSVSNTAKVVQFPLKLCFATTSHKFQGQTVVKPLKIVVDLRTVFGAAQAYVMLSRVQSIEQVFILQSLPKDKFYAAGKALEELVRLDNISINRNPPPWEQNVEGNLRIFSLNCQSLLGKMNHIREDRILGKSHVICLSETWLLSDETHENLQMEGFMLQTNSVGRGKGLATYYRPGVFQHCTDDKENNFQLTKLTSLTLDVITVYRSQEGKLNQLTEHLLNLIDMDQNTLICGDFNICFNADRMNKLIHTLEEIGFQQLVQEATHLQGGLIDHVYMRQCNDQVSVNCSLYSPYYCAMDHDALLTTVCAKKELD